MLNIVLSHLCHFCTTIVFNKSPKRYYSPTFDIFPFVYQSNTTRHLKITLINEVVMLIRLLHQKGVGEDFNLEETIGEYECSKVPQALLESNGSMRHGCKSGWQVSRERLTRRLRRCRLEDGFYTTFETRIFDWQCRHYQNLHNCIQIACRQQMPLYVHMLNSLSAALCCLQVQRERYQM